MTLEVDPDLRLYTRLSLGRGWRLATTAGLWLAGVWLLSTRRYVFFQFFLRAREAVADPGFLQVALILLILAPARAVARLLDLERGGLLDQTRLCGRPPHRVLAAFVAGATGPSVVLAALLLANHVRLAGQPGTIALAAVVFAGSLGASLAAYGALPPTMSLDSRFLTPLLFVFGAVAFVALRLPSWVQELDFNTLAARLSIAAVAVALTAGVRLARRRIERAPQLVARSAGASLQNLLSRLVVPNAGPPEFNRQLRSALLGGGTLVTLLTAPVVMLVGVRVSETTAFRNYSPLALNGVPYALMLIGAFAASMTVRREIEAATIDFVRLTPQNPEGVVVSWYAALSLPYWIAALLAIAVLDVMAPAIFAVAWPFAVLAVLWPAMAVVEAFQRRKPGTYLWLPLVLFAAIMTNATMVSPVPRGLEFSLMRRGMPAEERRAVLAERARSLTGGEWRRIDAAVPYQAWLITAMAAALALGAAAGRLRHADGPSLAGASAIAGAGALMLSLRHLPLMTYPRVLPCALALAAPFFAEERTMPTAPWTRAGIAAATVLAGSIWVTRAAGISWTGSALAASGGALAFVAALLLHEAAWQVPLLSLGLRLTALAALAGGSWRMLTDPSPREMLSFPSEASPLLTVTEFTLLAAAVVIAVALRVRSQSRSRAALYFPRHG